jgi:hypothetical protein
MWRSRLRRRELSDRGTDAEAPPACDRRGGRLQRALAAPLLAAAVLAGGCGSSQTLSAHALGKEADAVQSTAAEGALLAEDVAGDDTTEPFTRIHSGELAELAKQTASVLREGRSPGHEAERRSLLSRAEGTERALERLHASPTDRELARRLHLRLERLAG